MSGVDLLPGIKNFETDLNTVPRSRRRPFVLCAEQLRPVCLDCQYTQWKCSYIFVCSMASMEVIQYSVVDLYQGFALHKEISIEATTIMYVILGSGTALKLALYFYCLKFSKQSDSVNALAEDHLNDVASNLAAIITASIAGHIKKLWYVDPIGKSTPLPCAFPVYFLAKICS